MDYKQGKDRHQIQFLTYDSLIGENHLVRVLDHFIDGLDLEKFNFTYTKPKRVGRKAYNPKFMLKLYVYGYLRGIVSSRKLELATHENIPFIWLMKELKPDFKTIADFRKNNVKNIKSVFMEFNKYSVYMNLIDFELLAIDGTFIDAVNHNSKNISINKINTILKKIEAKFDTFNEQYSTNDKEQESKNDKNEQHLESIEKLKEKEEFYLNLKQELKDKGLTQISYTDPDSRMMQKDGSKRDVSYNCQSVTDSKNNLLLMVDACSDNTDAKQLYRMSSLTKEAYSLSEFSVVADKGYGFGREIKKCNENGIKTYVTMQDSEKMKGTPFATSKFKYDKINDCVICPNNRTLIASRKRNADRGHEYGSRKTCKGCPDLKACTNDNKQQYRTFTLNPYYEYVEKQLEINKVSKNILSQRKCIVEHPFGTIKRDMNQGRFLTKGLESVRGEFMFTALAYNIKRVFNILGFNKMMDSINAFFRRGSSKAVYFVKNIVLLLRIAINIAFSSAKLA